MRDPEAPSFFVSLVGDVEASGPTADAVARRGRFTRLEQQSPEGRWRSRPPPSGRCRTAASCSRRCGSRARSARSRRAPRRSSRGPLSGQATIAGPFDLRMLIPFLQDTTLAGPARIDLRASWDPKGVRMNGGLSIENGRMTLEQLAFTASQIKGELRLLGDRATLDATAAAGDGRVVLSGGMTFGPQLVGPGELRIEAQRVPINYPEGFRAPRDGHGARRRRRLGLRGHRRDRADAGVLHGRVQPAEAVARPARLAARRAARPAVAHRGHAARRAHPPRRPAADPQPPGAARHHRRAERRRDAGAAGGERAGDAARGRPAHGAPRAHPRAAGARRAQRLPGGHPRGRLLRADAGGRGRDGPARARLARGPAARRSTRRTARTCRRPTSSRCCSRGAPRRPPRARAARSWPRSWPGRSAACCRRASARRCSSTSRPSARC